MSNMKKIYEDLIEDYESDEYYLGELAEKYNLGRLEILRIIKDYEEHKED